MDKTINQKAWFLVLPVFLVVAFSAVLPLMTVVNYSMQDTFGNNQFFWNGVGWFKELLDPSSDLGGRFFASLWRNLFFSAVSVLHACASVMPNSAPGCRRALPCPAQRRASCSTPRAFMSMPTAYWSRGRRNG